MGEQCEEPGRHLADLQARGANIAPLLKLLLPSLAAALPQHPQLQPLLAELLHKVTLDAADVQAAAVQLLQAGAAGAAEGAAAGKQQQHLQQVLQVFDLRYPEQLDAAINAALQQAAAAAGSSDAAAAAAGKKAAKQKKSKQQQHPTDADSLFEFVQQCFSGSRHEVVPASQQQQQQQDAPGQQQQQALTLSLAVSAPASEMRIMALQKLDAICAAGNASESTQQLLHSSLVTCLRDDSLAVAGTAAAAAGLAAVPADLQLPALQYMLSRAADAFAAGSASKAADYNTSSSSATGGKAVLKAAKAALAAVAAVGQRAAAADAAASAADSSNAAAAGDIQQQAAAMLLEYALADKRLKKLARAAVSECCSANWHPLLQALSAAPNVAAALAASGAGEAAEAAAAPETSDSKRRKKAGSADAAAAPAAAAEGKHATAVALNRAVVQALADAMCASGSSSTGTALLDAAAAVADMCGPRCRHLLLLAMLKAATAADAAAAAGVDMPATPSKGRARGRHARHSSSQVAGDDSHSAAVSSARIAVALLHMLEQQLPITTSSSSSKRSTSSSSLALPDDWAATATDVLDADSLPNPGHLQQLHSQLPQLQAVLLLSGLRSALYAAAADSLTEMLGQPVQLFARLATAAAAAGAAGSSLQEHLQLLVLKSCAQPQQQLAFLSGVYGLPAGCCPEAPQVAALQLLHRQASEGSAWGVNGVDASSTSSSWLLSLLAAAGSSSKRVRSAAVDAILALPDAVAAAGSSWGVPGGFTAEHLSELVAALQQHEELLRNSSGSIVQLLCSAAAAGGAGAGAMDVDGAAAGSSKGRSRGRGRAGSAKAAACGDQAEDGAEMHLPAGCAAALQQLLLQALPQLHAESDLLAAELTVAVLVAGSSSDNAASSAAAAACELLQGLLLGLASNAHKVAAQRTPSKQQQQPMWQQLTGMLGSSADAVADAYVQLQQLRSAAAVASLQFVTPETVTADSTGVGSSFIQLLQLPFVDAAAAGLGAAAAGANSKLSDAQLAAVAPVRVAALQQFDAALFAALDQEQQQAAFTAALQAHASDGDAGCRAAARAALERIPITAGMVLQLLQRVGSSSAASKQQQSRAKRSKRSSSIAGSQSGDAMDVDTSAAAAGPVLAADLDAAIAALELLQWKDDVANKQQLLLQPLQLLLQLLTPLMGSIAESYTEQEDATTAVDAAADGDGVAPSAAAAVASPSAAGYAAQLALATLEQLAKEDGAAAAAAVDPGLVLSCAAAAPDGAVRNAALLLLAVLSQQSPEDVLGHVLQVSTLLYCLVLC
jgi:hypothetical protein